MGRSKKKFIEKKEAVKFKLVYRSAEDPNYQKGTLADRVFQVIEDKKSLNNKDSSNEIKMKKAKILSGFSDKDLGKYENPRKIVNFVVDEEDKSPNESPSFKPKEKSKKKMKGIEGRSDLWINHLNKNRSTTENSNEKKPNKLKEEEDEWEDCEEIQEGEEEYKENIEEKEKTEETKNQTQNVHLSELSEKLLAMKDPLNILENFSVNPNVKMKYYDENGFLIDGYDYYQHVAKKNNEGVVACVFNANYETPPELKPDLDYQPNEMTPEQKEVFEALEYEGQEEVYEIIEDDFVDLANCGEKCLDSKPIAPKKEEEKKKIKQQTIENDMDENDNNIQIPNILTKQDFKKIVNEYIAHMENKNGKKNLKSDNPVKEIENKSDEETEEEEVNEEIYVKKPDLKSENKQKIDPEEIFTNKFYDKLDIKEDFCLQQCIMKESSESDYDEMSDNDNKKISQENDSITIENNIYKENKATPNLNIISEKREDMKKKKKNQEENSINEEKQSNLKCTEVFKKREKDETNEEKAERKARIKAFKQERKEKKQKFKEEFKYQHMKELKKSRPNHNIPHVSVYKL